MSLQHTPSPSRQIQELLQASPMGAFQIDHRGYCFFSNLSWTTISGLSPEASAGKSWMQIVLPEDIATIDLFTEQAIRDRKRTTFTFRINHSKKGLRFLQANMAPVTPEGQSISYFVMYIQDITTHRLAESHIEKQKALCAVLKQFQDGFLQGNSPNNQFRTFLDDIITLTGSTSGFIGEVIPAENRGSPTVRSLTSDPEHADIITDHVTISSSGPHVFAPVITQVLRKKDICTGELPDIEDSSGALPWIGIPARLKQQTQGILILSGNPEGYDNTVAELLSPLISAFASLVVFHRMNLAKSRMESRQNELKKHLDSLISSLEDIILEVDGNMVFRSVWARDNNLLFLPKKKLIGRKPEDVFGDKAGFFTDYLQKVMQTGKTISLEYQHINPEIDQWFKAKITPINEDPRPEHYKMAVVIQDITERTKYIAALKAEKEKLEHNNLLFDFSQELSKIGGWENNVETGAIIWTKQTHTIFGLSPSDTDKMDCQSLWELFEERGAGIFKEKALQCLQDQKPYDVTCPVHMPDGSRKWIRAIARPMLHEGRVTVLRGVVLDITQQKETELILKQTQKNLERSNLILDTSQGLSKTGGWENNLETGEIFWTRQHHEILEIPKKDIDKMSHRDLFRYIIEEDQAYVKNAFKEMIRKKAMRNIVFRILTVSGKQKWVRSIGFPVLKDNKVYMLRGAIMDITRKKENELALTAAKEIAEKAARAQNDFLSVMSHEIRTPLNGIIGITNLLKLNHTPEQKEFIDNLMFSADHLLQLINDILDLNKIESDKLELVQSEMDLPELIAHIKNQFQSLADAKGIKLLSRIDRNIPHRILGDSIRISQILNNLVSNAIKFTDKGRVSVTLRMLSATPTHVIIHFSIKDTGLGIPKKMEQTIFESFRQIQQEAYRKHSGTGLGLTITKKLLALHNSEIFVQSQPGKGTRFSFDLMLELPSDKTPAKITPKELSRYANKLSYIRLLFVEDNKVNAMVARKQLEYFGIHSDYACHGSEALEFLRTRTYDIALIDLHMPDIDGYALSAIIKKEHPDIHIVIFTADIMKDVRQRLADMGIYDILNKPFVPTEMLAVLLKTADQKNLRLRDEETIS